MNHLFTYVSAIDKSTDELNIVDKVQRQRVIEADGITTESSELIVVFDNGVVLRRVSEQDYYDGPADAVCADCWIAYDVIRQPETIKISPDRKCFTNPCQESFWLKINRIQSAE